MGVVPGDDIHHRPGHHDGAGADDGDEVQHRKAQGQQQAVGLPDEEKAQGEDEKHHKGDNQLALQVAAEGLHEDAPHLSAEAAGGGGHPVGDEKPQPGIVGGDEVGGH